MAADQRYFSRGLHRHQADLGVSATYGRPLPEEAVQEGTMSNRREVRGPLHLAPLMHARYHTTSH